VARLKPAAGRPMNVPGLRFPGRDRCPTIPAPIPTDDERRLLALREMLILDTPPEERVDRVVRFAADEFDMPIVLVSLIDPNRQWFKARAGLDVCETDRESSLCAHAIARPQVMGVEDTHVDERLHDNPLVLGAPHIRFYAGATLQLPGGAIIGTLCMIDRQPRTLDAMELAIFGSLRDLVGGELVAQEVGLELMSRVRKGDTKCAAGVPMAVMAASCGTPLALRLKELDVRRLLLRPFKVNGVLDAIVALRAPAALPLKAS
jgi:hypothetical protein